MIAHYILPWFGGTNAVWSAVVLFFQIMLVGGYLYADWLSKSIPPERQWRIHGTLLAVACSVILLLSLFWPAPIIPSASWRPTVTEQPILYIFFLLTISVGIPYFTLASNSPLIQSWFAYTYTGRSPYWLYALSNAGSLFGLLSYPILIEPSLRLGEQGWLWSGLYLAFVALNIYILWHITRVKGTPQSKNDEDRSSTESVNTPLLDSFLWLMLSAIATVMMLSVTNRLTQDVAPIPMLWILPLTLYLLSFIIAFAGEQYYHRFTFVILASFAFIGVVFTPLIFPLSIILQIGLNLIFLFAVCMIAHGEIYRLRPASKRLTNFYLFISIGGAMGGIIVNFIAPSFFNDYWEFYLGSIAIYCFLILLGARHFRSSQRTQSVIIGVASTVMMIFIGYTMLLDGQNVIWRDRNFYGVLRVLEQNDAILLVHGSTVHGAQFIDPDKRNIPTSYYHADSGIGLALAAHPRYGQEMKVGVVGLGIGTLAAYGQAGDVYRFYEINPLVTSLAKGEHGFFSFLSDGESRGVTIDIIPGDARISLEQELAQGKAQNYDVLVIDAFSSDSIPVHLLTQEAFALYLQHLAPDGMLAIHISNRYLDLAPLIWAIARQHDLTVGIVYKDTPPDKQTVISPSLWALLTRQSTLFERPQLVNNVDTTERFSSNLQPWTDDYSNLFQLLKGIR